VFLMPHSVWYSFRISFSFRYRYGYRFLYLSISVNVSQQRPTWWFRVLVYFWFCR